MQSENIICNCMQVSLSEIKAAINAGAVRLEDIQESTGATTGCGRCTLQVKEILVNEKQP